MFESAGGDAGLWLSRLFGSGGGMPIAANTAPTGTDFGAALGAMNPGMAGMGAVPDEAFNASQPFTTGNTALGNVSSKDLSGALGKLGGGGGAAAAGKGAGPVMPGAGGGGAGVGRPSPQSLATLLQMLNQRRDLLLQSATGGVGAGQAQGARPTAGLLGF